MTQSQIQKIEQAIREVPREAIRGKDGAQRWSGRGAKKTFRIQHLYWFESKDLILRRFPEFEREEVIAYLEERRDALKDYLNNTEPEFRSREAYQECLRMFQDLQMDELQESQMNAIMA